MFQTPVPPTGWRDTAQDQEHRWPPLSLCDPLGVRLRRSRVKKGIRGPFRSSSGLRRKKILREKMVRKHCRVPPKGQSSSMTNRKSLNKCIHELDLKSLTQCPSGEGQLEEVSIFWPADLLLATKGQVNVWTEAADVSCWQHWDSHEGGLWSTDENGFPWSHKIFFLTGKFYWGVREKHNS